MVLDALEGNLSQYHKTNGRFVSQESGVNYQIHLRLCNQNLMLVFLTTHVYMPCDKKALRSSSVSECGMLANVSVITETMKITSHTIDTNTSNIL